MSLCGLRTFDIELLCLPSCEIIVLPYAGNHKEKSTWLLIIKLWASAFQMPENKLVSRKRPLESIPVRSSRIHFSMAAKILSNNGGSTSYRGCLAEQTREQRDQLRTDENDAATAHELLHALGLCLCVIKKH